MIEADNRSFPAGPSRGQNCDRICVIIGTLFYRFFITKGGKQFNTRAFCNGMGTSRVSFASRELFEEMPSYSVVGEKDGKVYVAEYPSDVQADVENEQNMNDYMEVYEEVDKIRTGGSDSPLVLK